MKLFSVPVVVAVTVFGFASFASAADEAGEQPGGVRSAPSMAGDYRGCATCNSAATACNSCGKLKKHFHKCCTPYQTTLCPGACFGYFQTQWHRWENVCPIPYQGVGLTDTPARVAPPAPVVPKTTGSDVPLPKNLPMVPMVPGK